MAADLFFLFSFHLNFIKFVRKDLSANQKEMKTRMGAKKIYYDHSIFAKIKFFKSQPQHLYHVFRHEREGRPVGPVGPFGPVLPSQPSRTAAAGSSFSFPIEEKFAERSQTAFRTIYFQAIENNFCRSVALFFNFRDRMLL